MGIEIRTKYPGVDSTSNQRQSWGSQHGINIDETGLVIPGRSQEIDKKIYPALPILKQELQERRLKGQHVLLLPGGYDLVHVGHASFVMQATNHYLNSNPYLGRNELYVVALVDDDELIGEGKKSAYIKVTGKKGPIETGDLERTHPRLRAMASTSVDAVAPIPAPTRNIEHPLHTNLDHELFKSSNMLGILKLKNESFAERIHTAIDQLPKIRQKIRSGAGLLFDTEYWSLESWQLYMLSWLNENHQPEMAPMVRLISATEEKYVDIVSTITDMCNIKVGIFDDEFCVSTKELVQKYGIEELLRRKKETEI